MSRRSILFAAGGSGGHLFPAIAVAEELRERHPDWSIGIVASEKAIDRSILARHPFTSHHLAAASPSALLRHPWRVVRDNWRAWQAARDLVRQECPAVVVGCGGFASVPLVVAGMRARIPVVLLEQNLIPGRATVWLSRWAAKICLSFEETRAYLPRSVTQRADAVPATGNPIRRQMIPIGDEPARLSNQLLVLGGSQGARHVNEAVAEWVCSRPAELKGWQLLHQTGSGDHTAILQRYTTVADHLQAAAVEFIDDLSGHLQAATLVIARAGATSLAELAAVGAPTILIPLPTAARDHQVANARWYEQRQAAQVVIQQPAPAQTAQELARVVAPLLKATPLREALGRSIIETSRPHAAEQVTEIIEQLVTSRNSSGSA